MAGDYLTKVGQEGRVTTAGHMRPVWRTVGYDGVGCGGKGQGTGGRVVVVAGDYFTKLRGAAHGGPVGTRYGTALWVVVGAFRVEWCAGAGDCLTNVGQSGSSSRGQKCNGRV